MSDKHLRDQDLRQQAFALIDEGWTSKEAAELLEIKMMTICGWLSWRTRGHYEGEEDEQRAQHAKEMRNGLRIVK